MRPSTGEQSSEELSHISTQSQGHSDSLAPETKERIDHLLQAQEQAFRPESIKSWEDLKTRQDAGFPATPRDICSLPASQRAITSRELFPAAALESLDTFLI